MKIYTTPKLKVYIIQIEEAIANGSALTKPMASEDVLSEWEIGTDQQDSFTWE